MFKTGEEIGQKEVIVEICKIAVLQGEWDSQSQCYDDILRGFESLYEH